MNDDKFQDGNYPKVFKRTNALNKFQLSTCEFHILQNLDKLETRVNDDVNIFYKRIEKQILEKNDEFWLRIKQRRRYQTLDALKQEQNNSEGSDWPSDEVMNPLVCDEMEHLYDQHGYKSTFARDE